MSLIGSEKWDMHDLINPPRAAYLHIPFCRRRCYYCDFPISVVGDRLRGETSGMMADYVTTLCQEIQPTPPLGPPLDTIFFGGGTPSLLASDQLARIVQTLETQFGIAPDAEFSMEMDPGTFNQAQLQSFLAVGVNRISLGGQAFQDEHLKNCGRSHQVTDIYRAIELLHQAQVKNFGLDLISGLPQQTLEDWQDSLTQACDLQPTHLSTYDLVLEPTTVFGKRYHPGQTPLPSDDLAAQMYRLSAHYLGDRGYDHYEISNFARPGYRCRHNLVYWHNQSYYGFGMGATSYLNHRRFSRPTTRAAYAHWLAAGGIAASQNLAQTERGDRLFETLMLGLRLREGLDLEGLIETYGAELRAPLMEAIQPFCAAGLIEDIDLSAPHPSRLALSDPEGFLLSNTILVEIWDALDRFHLKGCLKS
jgi:oxygen-independent coproporphyrinogen-3 oxidase